MPHGGPWDTRPWELKMPETVSQPARPIAISDVAAVQHQIEQAVAAERERTIEHAVLLFRAFARGARPEYADEATNLFRDELIRACFGTPINEPAPTQGDGQ